MLITPKLIFMFFAALFALLFLKSILFGGTKDTTIFCIFAIGTCLLCIVFLQGGFLNTVLFKI